MPDEPGHVAGAGAAGIDEGGGTGARCHLLGVDTERGASPIDVGVEVDEAGKDEVAGAIDVARGRLADGRRQLRDLAAGESDIERRVEILHRIDHAAVSDQQVVGHRVAPGKISWRSHITSAAPSRSWSSPGRVEWGWKPASKMASNLARSEAAT